MGVAFETGDAGRLSLANLKLVRRSLFALGDEEVGYGGNEARGRGRMPAVVALLLVADAEIGPQIPCSVFVVKADDESALLL